MNETTLLATPAPDRDADAAIDRILVVIDSLLELIEAENLELSGGMPAPLASTVAAKTRLSGELSAWVEAIKSGRVDLAGAPEAKRLWLAQRSQQLSSDMQDNMARILAAMEASKRRINAVMRAAREQQSVGRSYTSRGFVNLQPAGEPGHGRVS